VDLKRTINASILFSGYSFIFISGSGSSSIGLFSNPPLFRRNEYDAFGLSSIMLDSSKILSINKLSARTSDFIS
jgi:hypothetical protein